MNIMPWLTALGFEKRLGLYELNIRGSIITVDIKKEKIKYPNLKEIGRETTLNFSAEENFVVLDIVIGLLKQGYIPNQISIEKGYRLGHNTKSGNADITVEDNNGDPFLIIEAKTYGSEFEKEWKRTLDDGGQLFSYEKQDNKAKVLVLYASHVSEGNVSRVYHAISLTDNKDFLLSLEKPRGYKDAKGGNDKFEIWRDTYQYDYLTNGVLEQTIKPFAVSKSKISTANLKEITHDKVQKKYNQFATILRKHNVGGRENAFDKLVNLFLAKIVDEQQNPDDLQFNWKGAAQDTYFELVDRLQKLYQIGMEKFLNEKVSYVAEKDVKDAFRLRKDAAKDAILEYFKELKYFSNNDFSFLDVYNEQLFYQNSKILVEVVQMLQDMKLRTEEQNQFLGDLFEGFLDNGVKQSEGQFFTPLPIVKFIVSSLPLEEINKQKDIPKVLDYACGAGHFLNEYAEQIKRYVNEEDLANYHKEIYGIEKEYRLSKVAKVSAFMYGQDNINIIYGDALIEHNGIEDNSYSVIVANPPYSVRGFLETLSDKQREKYELSEVISRIDTNNSIELFFLERTEQLLKSQGVAGIIVPSSILSNGNFYIKSRKMIIENFDIIAIVELGSKTFGSTGTNTVILFLRKKKYPPKEFDNYKYAVERWFAGVETQEYDESIIQSYCDMLGIEYDDYLELQEDLLDKLLEVELFEEYIKEFEKTAAAKSIKRKRITDRYSQADKDAEMQRKQLAYIKEIEQEKVTYFSLANSQNNEVIVVKSPTKSADMKQFLGYEWSKRKGQEGIKYIGANISDDEMEVSKNQAINSIKTPLFNPLNLEDNERINTIIRNNFSGELKEIPLKLKPFMSISTLVDMLDFTRTSFDAQIKTTPDEKLEIVSKYPLVKLGMMEGVSIQKGSAITQAQTKQGNVKVVAGGIGHAYTHNTSNREANIITVSASGANAGFVNYWDEPIYASDATTIQASTVQETKYIYNFLKSQQQSIFGLARGAAQPHVYPKDIANFPIPQVDDNIQKQILKSVEELDKKYQSSRMKIEEYRKQIAEIFENLDILGGVEYRLSSKDFTVTIGKRVLNSELTEDGIPVYSANVFVPFGRINKDILKDFSKPSILWGIDGDWMVNTIPANQPFYPTDHAGVLRINTDKINYRYLAHKLEQIGNKEGFSRSYRASIGQIEKITVAIPDIDKQNSAVKKINKIEVKIKNEEITMLKIQEQKMDVIEKHLN